MTKRRTVRLNDIVARVNKLNRESMCLREHREGWNGLLEFLLHDAGRYCGFGYLSQEDVPTGEEPGIIRGETPQKNEFPDESRRFYYYRD